MANSPFEPSGPPPPVCEPGDFPFAAVGLDHPHIYGQCEGLVGAGAGLRYVYDADSEKVAAFKKRFPGVEVAASEEEVLEHPDIKLVASATVPSERCALGLRVMAAGKDYFVDKGPFTTLEQLKVARKQTAETNQKYMVYYSERLHVECAVFASELVKKGVIGRVVQVLGLGPHRLGLNPRPDWFFQKEKYGGILCDIGSHQAEQFLHYSGANDAQVTNARVANVHHPDRPELEDFGEAGLIADNGTSGYFRVDWLTPDGLGAWGDGRLVLLGTEGYIELRKYIDVAREGSKDHLYLVDKGGEHHLQLEGRVGFPFFGDLILDCLNRTEHAMTQAHAFKAAELCLKAQALADQKRKEV